MKNSVSNLNIIAIIQGIISILVSPLFVIIIRQRRNALNAFHAA